MCHHPKPTLMSVFCPGYECSKRGSTLYIAEIRNTLHHPLPIYAHGHTFVVNNTFKDDSHPHSYLDLIFVSPQIYKSPGHASRKTNLFVRQRDCCTPDTWTRNQDIDYRFCQKIQKSFCARKVYPNTLLSDNTRSQ